MVSRSSAVAGEIREYERFSTTVANAFVQPIAGRYLTSMEDDLSAAGIPASLQIMLSSGGVTTPSEARQRPVRLIESGPAAGALIAAHYARTLDKNRVLAFDMGGTTAKLCAIRDGRPTVGNHLEVARVHRFKQGSGLPIRAPSVEMIEIGAGGGSIAAFDSLGLLAVGPASAGAHPGPACYGRGGTQPTVTDADLLVGHLNPDYFLGGEMPLDVEAATAAIESSLSGHLGLTPVEVAAGIIEVVNETMATAASVYLAEHGEDPRRFTLIATGGAGPLHAVEVARKLGIATVVIPPSAGVASAGGLLVAPPRIDGARSLLMRLDAIDWTTVDQLFGELESEALATLTAMNIDQAEIEMTRSVDARYVNQGHEITVELPAGIVDDRSARSRIHEAFNCAYRSLFGRTVDGVAIECVTWRSTVQGPDGSLAAGSPQPTPSTTDSSTRPVHQSNDGRIDTTIYRRSSLQPGDSFNGPAIVEESQSTTVIGPGDRFSIDATGNLIVAVKAGGIL